MMRSEGGRPTGGEVYLVGAGPGDPELLTLRALRLLRQSDIVLYDRLVGQGVLDLVNPAAELIYVGKACRRHFVEQNVINQLLVDFARQGKRVCRLKGGDPFIFGRGGEELEKLAAHGIPFQVVPGVTAAAAGAAYAGIPLTHRDYAHSVVFAAGHRREESELDWTQLSRRNQTIVLYMGLRNIAWISAQLQAHGVDPALPAAIIERATSPDQRVLVGRLDSLAELADQVSVGAPALIIIGGVVRLHGKLHWFRPGHSPPSSAQESPEPLST